MWACARSSETAGWVTPPEAQIAHPVSLLHQPPTFTLLLLCNNSNAKLLVIHFIYRCTRLTSHAQLITPCFPCRLGNTRIRQWRRRTGPRGPDNAFAVHKQNKQSPQSLLAAQQLRCGNRWPTSAEHGQWLTDSEKDFIQRRWRLWVHLHHWGPPPRRTD